MADITLWLEAGANFATVLGIPIAIVLLYIEKERERRDREYGTYNALDERYISFLELQAQYPDLLVYDPPKDSANWAALDTAQRRRQQMLFQILVSILERAFLMYRDQSDAVKKKEYDGWLKYMQDYAATPNFAYAWRELGLGEQFHEDFVEKMNAMMRSA